MPCQLSVHLQSFQAEDPGDWSHLVDLAAAADLAGVDRLVLSDHVVFGEHLDAYADPSLGGTAGGQQPTGPDGMWLDPIITIAYLAAVTTRVRFGTSILLAALRRPVVLAKMAATIDVLSRGRLDIGVGVGWQREEYEAAGLPFERRGELLNQTLDICQGLWRNPVFSYDGDGVRFDGIHQMPKPVQSGGVPIWVSGTVNKGAMDRLARYGSGWIPWGPDAGDVVVGIERMRNAMNDRGRDPSSIGVVANLRTFRDEHGRIELGRTLEPLPQLHAAGVTDLRVRLLPPTDGESLPAELAELVGAFREVVSAG
jgi:probable F420-dependent oxidoreductase